MNGNMKIPTAEELDAWECALKKGQAVTGMMPRFLEGYRRLLEETKLLRKIYDIEAETLDNSFTPYDWRFETDLDSIEQDPMVLAMRKVLSLRAVVPEKTRPR